MAETTNKIAMRPQVIHYLGGHICGEGWTKFSENPGANTDEVLYINSTTASSETTDYSASYDIEADLMYTEPSIKLVYDIAANRKIGEDAVIEHIKVDTFSGDAWKDTVAVAISSIDGEKKMSMSGTLNVRGNSIHGTYDAETKTFTPTVTPIDTTKEG